MTILRMWSICDRCGWKYRRRQLRAETAGFVVCNNCHDGAFDLKNHPQNKAASPRREPSIVPDGRIELPLVPTTFLITENGQGILTEDGEQIYILTPEWNPRNSVYF
jgi:hypothetical protein